MSYEEKLLLEEKMKALLSGYSAYVESEELIRLLKQRVAKQDIDVFLDETEFGCWFIPNQCI
jgi:hypothetical protein